MGPIEPAERQPYHRRQSCRGAQGYEEAVFPVVNEVSGRHHGRQVGRGAQAYQEAVFCVVHEPPGRSPQGFNLFVPTGAVPEKAEYAAASQPVPEQVQGHHRRRAELAPHVLVRQGPRSARRPKSLPDLRSNPRRLDESSNGRKDARRERLCQQQAGHGDGRRANASQCDCTADQDVHHRRGEHQQSFSLATTNPCQHSEQRQVRKKRRLLNEKAERAPPEICRHREEWAKDQEPGDAVLQ